MRRKWHNSCPPDINSDVDNLIVGSANTCLMFIYSGWAGLCTITEAFAINSLLAIHRPCSSHLLEGCELPDVDGHGAISPALFT